MLDENLKSNKKSELKRSIPLSLNFIRGRHQRLWGYLKSQMAWVAVITVGITALITPAPHGLLPVQVGSLPAVQKDNDAGKTASLMAEIGDPLDKRPFGFMATPPWSSDYTLGLPQPSAVPQSAIDAQYKLRGKTKDELRNILNGIMILASTIHCSGNPLICTPRG